MASTLVYRGKDEGLRHLLEGIERINRETRSNYVVRWKMLNAVHFGVPQRRERVFLIGSSHHCSRGCWPEKSGGS